MALSKLLDSKSSTTPASNPTQPSHRSSATHSITTIAEGVKIAGVLSIQGDAKIDGELEGELHCFGSLTLSQNARVHGSVCASTVYIAGSVYGDVLAERKIVLQAPAHVEGSISAPSVAIEDGVHFEGECVMKGSPITATHPSDTTTGIDDTSEAKAPSSTHHEANQKSSLVKGDK